MGDDLNNDSSNNAIGEVKHFNLGLNIVAGFIVFTFIGYKIDEKRGKGSLFTLLGMFLGLFYCGYEIWKLIRKTS